MSTCLRWRAVCSLSRAFGEPYEHAGSSAMMSRSQPSAERPDLRRGGGGGGAGKGSFQIGIYLYSSSRSKKKKRALKKASRRRDPFRSRKGSCTARQRLQSGKEADTCAINPLAQADCAEKQRKWSHRGAKCPFRTLATPTWRAKATASMGQ